MTEERWTTGELYRIGDADEFHIAPRRENGTLRRAVPIRMVDELYGRYTGYVEPMVAPRARTTTLRLVPGSEAGA